MNKIYIFILLLAVTANINLFAQEKIEAIENGFSIQVKFDEPLYSDKAKGVFTVRDYIDFTDASKSGEFKLPSQSFLIAIPPDSKPLIELVDPEIEIISNVIPAIQPIAKFVNDSTIAMEEIENYSSTASLNKISDIEIIGYGWYREYYYVQVKINTHQYDFVQNQIKRIKRATINIKARELSSLQITPANLLSNNDKAAKIFLNQSIAHLFVSNQPAFLQDTTGNWIKYNLEYLKLGTAKDGIFRITKSDLESRGINTSQINPKTFQLFKSGKEIPVTVFGESDNTFDENDYIEFYGSLNYPEISHRIINAADKPYNEYLDRYSDTTLLFLTWNDQAGLRIPVQSNALQVNDTLTYYKSIQHIEFNHAYQNCYTDEVNNQTPGWFRNKSWFIRPNDWLYNGSIKNYNFNCPDLISDKQAKFFYKGVSYGSSIQNNSHQLTLKVNNVLLDSQSINRNDQVLLNGTLSSNLLVSGQNTLSVRNIDNGTPSNSVVFDWYDIEYPRLSKLEENFLILNVPDDITNSIKVIQIEDAGLSEYIIYRIKPSPKKIDNYLVESNKLYFADTVVQGSVYVITATNKIFNPQFYYKKSFANLRSITDQADYIAITHPKFFQSAQNYVNAVASLFNFTSSIISVEDISDEFGYGYNTPEAIRLFNSVNYQNRQQPKPLYLTLIGDANYDYKLYRFKFEGAVGGGNYVPSYGNPISDNWLVIWDETALPIPQLKVGRLPINTSSELDYYLSKIQNNFSQPYDEWNKRYLFFSGGRIEYPGEIADLRAVNNNIINSYIKPAPVAGSSTHFYKTINPVSDFGPYTTDEFKNAIDKGGVFISYLGHSGTATWDNSINETVQLKNKVNRNPLITDFGCSTNKYGEPDIVSFGERFVLNADGQAIGYVGNSSLGFTSTSYTVPVYFYQDVINSNTKEVGDAHLSSKIKMFQNIGTSQVYKVFALTNTLIGDPVVQIKIPGKPNLNIFSGDIHFVDEVLYDNVDSALVKIVFNNYGTQTTSSFQYRITHKSFDSTIETYTANSNLPGFVDTIAIWIKTKNLAGENTLSVSLDTENIIDELYEDDNDVTANFYVYSTALRDIIKHRLENSSLNQLKVLSPTLFDKNNFNIIFQLSEFEDFRTFNQNTFPADSFFTNITLNGLTQRKRYWLRYKIDETNSLYSNVKSFYNLSDKAFYLGDSLTLSNQILTDLKLSAAGLTIAEKFDLISVTSAGYNAGSTCVIAKNQINLLSNSYFAGMGIAVFDNVTLSVDTSTYYNLFNNPVNMQALVDLINAIPEGKIVAMGVADDAANNITPDLKNAIKTLGSTKIDSLLFRGSWAIIGRKGASPGNVIEVVKKPTDGLIYIDSTFNTPNFIGTFETEEIGIASKWENVSLSQTIPDGASITHSILGVKNDGSIDSINTLTLQNNTADISFVNSKLYPKIKIKSQLHSNQDGISPTLSSIGVDYKGLAELGTNYQVVSTDKDTVLEGDYINLKFWLFNVGEANADSFKVKVNVNAPSLNSVLLDTLIFSLTPDTKKMFNVRYHASNAVNPINFVISIDQENKVKEYYKDNNFFTKSFFIQKDLIAPTLNITFDNNKILDGDFVSSNPDIRIELSDESPLPINDTTAANIWLNDKRVYYAFNQQLTYSINPNNPKFVVNYKPILDDGEYTLRVAAKDQSGNSADSVSGVVNFAVSSQVDMLNVYNYPNPFSESTYFTFRLAQLPDEIKIKIFTIAGRLIKEIHLNKSELNYEFNKIYWDGNDADGDRIANGTYIYKMILKNGDQTKTLIQKLVKSR